MGNLIETVLQDAVLVSVQGSGDVSAHSVQMMCILRMYREACTYSKDSTGYTICMQCRVNKKCMARPTGHESIKGCNLKYYWENWRSEAQFLSYSLLKMKKMFEVSTLDFNAVCCVPVR